MGLYLQQSERDLQKIPRILLETIDRIANSCKWERAWNIRLIQYKVLLRNNANRKPTSNKVRASTLSQTLLWARKTRIHRTRHTKRISSTAVSPPLTSPPNMTRREWTKHSHSTLCDLCSVPFEGSGRMMKGTSPPRSRARTSPGWTPGVARPVLPWRKRTKTRPYSAVLTGFR